MCNFCRCWRASYGYTFMHCGCVGDEHPLPLVPHCNCKPDSGTPYKQARPSTLRRMREVAREHRPKDVVEIVDSVAGGVEDGDSLSSLVITCRYGMLDTTCSQIAGMSSQLSWSGIDWTVMKTLLEQYKQHLSQHAFWQPTSNLINLR